LNYYRARKYSTWSDLHKQIFHCISDGWIPVHRARHSSEIRY